MKELINVIVADRIMRVAVIISLSLLLIAIGYTFFFYGNLPPYIPLFNQLGWGDPRLAEKIYIFLPTLAAILVVIGNTIVSAMVYTSLPLISRMIAITSLLISALTLIFIFRVTQLVI